MAEKKYWLDNPRNVDRLVRVLWAACALVVLSGLFYAPHPHFGWDGWFGFFAAFGFVAYCFIVLSAKQLRRLIARGEDYYGDDDPNREPPAADEDRPEPRDG